MAEDKTKGAAVADPKKVGLDGERPSGLRPEDLYAEVVKPEPKPPDKADDDAKVKKADKKPAKAEPDAEPDAAAKAAADEKRWDEERQRRDQDHANERRLLEGQVTAMREQVTALSTQLAAAAKPAAHDKVAEKRLASLERLEGQLAGLSGESDPGAIAGAMRMMGGLMTDLMTAERDTATVDPSEVQKILDRLGKIETGFQDLAAMTTAQAAETTLERTLQRLDAEFGAKHRNAALKAARDLMGARGRSADNPPTDLETELVLRNAYMAEAAGDKKPGDMPTGNAGVLPGDTGAGGSATQHATGKAGTLPEVLDMMRQEGKVR